MAQPPVSPVPTPADAVPEMTVYVQRDGTPMYDGAGTAYDIMDTFACGQEAIRLSEEGGWTQVRIDGQMGYISHENLSDTQVWPTMPQAFTNPRIVIYKSRRVLMLYDGDRCYGRYAVALGWAPVGDKREEGDGKTPEGTYYVCYRNANSSFYRSLGLSYPNEADAARGLREGLIDQEAYTRIARAIENRRQPPWNTALGGEIMIHGGGIESDWTAGCVALTDADMDVLWTMCPIGTMVEIVP